MDLTHRFRVPAQIDAAWNAFNNIEGLAPCFPGTTITSIEGDEFTGSVKIKFGPITLAYDGSGRYLERNDADRRVVIEARGEDQRGNGTASATVTATLVEDGELTGVEVLTDLTITGKPAQFGPAVISDVSDRLMEQFVSCVSGRFGDGLGTTQQVAPASVVAARTAGFDQADTEQTIELEAVPAAEDLAATAALAGVTPPTTEPAPPTAPRAFESPRAAPASDEARKSTLDVLGTVGPVLLRRYGPALAVFGLLLFVVIKIIRRKS
jgi:carbon monoxide dehydrogenase subunit G